MKILNTKKAKVLKYKLLVMALSAIMTGTVTTSVVRASDVQIYQNPTATKYPIIMLAIDNSFSMAINDAYYNNTRMSRLDALKRSLVTALQALNTDGTYKIPNITYMGLSKFAGDVSNARRSRIWVPAKRLDALVSGTKTQRQFLIEQINGLGADSSTPTSTLFAETYAYLLGSRTDSPNAVNNFSNGYQADLSGISNAVAGTVSNGKYIAPIESLPNENDKQCSTQGVFFLTDGAPSGIPAANTQLLLKNVVANAGITGVDGNTISGSVTDVPAVYYNYSKARGSATTNGEFYEMKLSPTTNELTTNNTVTGYQDRSGWSYIADLVKATSTTATTTSKKRIYLATVGFGPLFNTAVNSSGARVETCDKDGAGRNTHCYIGSGGVVNTNLGNSDTSPYSNTLNADALKMLGDKVGEGDTYGTDKPIGGYTYADTGEKVQNALLRFVGAISQGTFEAASFGTYVVPADPMATSASYSYVFAPQFQPKVSGSGGTIVSTQQLWLGNLKKYTLNSSGTMVDVNGNTVLKNTGGINTLTQDFWNAENINDGDDALKGGAWSQLSVPNASSGTLSTVTNASDIQTRPLYINATIPTALTDTNKNKVVAANSLTQLSTQNVLTASYIDSTAGSGTTAWRQNVYQPYLLSALGYKLTKTELEVKTAGYKWDTVDKVKNLNVMQQMGGVLHSDPLLVTLEAKYDPTTGVILSNTQSTVNRKDYIVMGSIQGLLHILNQATGKEEMAFLPNEILQDVNRRDALLDVSNTTTSTTNPFYGIDAQWGSWVEYNIDATNNKFKANIANIYGGMRMGGKSYYGLNIKNPSDPKFLFQIDPVNGVINSSTSGVSATGNQVTALQAMGQSWSKPTLAKIRFNNQVKNVMIVGGGYDPAYETDGYQPTATTVNAGAGIYIFDATTGALLWDARYGSSNNTSTVDVKDTNLKYSVVSQIKAFDRDADGLVDNLYFGDLGGQIFRVDLNNGYGTSTTNFGRVNRFANFSALNQRFYEMPTLSIHDRNGSRFGVLGIASGNRSFPLNKANSNDNRIYALYDYDIASSNLYNSTFSKTSNLTESDLYNWSAIASTNVANLMNNTKKGWYYVLRETDGTVQTANTGTVKALNGYLVVANTAQFSDFYVSLYNPNHASTQQPNACTGGITGSSVIRRLCLPYGVCGDATDASHFDANKSGGNVGNASDGISKINAGGFSNGVNNLIKLLPEVGRNYKTTKIFQSTNWYERQ